MKSLMIAAEFLLGVAILMLTVLCIAAAGIVTLFEIPKYLQHTRK